MKQIQRLLMLAAMLLSITSAMASTIVASTTEPGEGITPEHLYTMANGNSWYCNLYTAPTQTEANRALFAFYSAGTDGAYYIYNYTKGQWLTYTKADSYANKVGFVEFSDTKPANYFYVSAYSGENYQIAPYNNSGVAGKYLNWYQGSSSNTMDGSTTLGLWQQGGSDDSGSRWTFAEVDLNVTYTNVTYNVYDNETRTLLKTYTQSEAVGQAPSFALPSYVTVNSGMPATTEATTVNLYTTAALPFTVTTDTNTPTYYSLRLRSTKYLSAAAGASTVTLSYTAPTVGDNNDYEFYITGNWADGFNLVSKQTGTKVTSSSTGNGQAVSFSAAGTRYILDTNGTGNYLFYADGTSYSYLSDFGGTSNSQLKHYNTKADAGNYFTFTPVVETTYTVHVTGYTGATVSNGTTSLGDGQTFTSWIAPSASAFAAQTIDGYSSSLTLSGTDINVVYTKKVSDTETDVTYNYKVNDKIVYTTTTRLASGEAYPTKASTPWGLTFVSSDIPNAARQSSDATTFYINYKTSSYPFTWSLTNDEDDATWQTIKSNPGDTNNGCRYWYYDSANGTSNVPTTQTASEADDYMWKFVGNPFEGYTIYNKGAGSTMTGNLSNGYFKLTATDAPTKWKPYSSQQNAAGYFSLSADGSNYINTQSGYLKTWTAADGGSTMVTSAPYELVELPYSTEANPHYYLLQFYTGSAALADQGSGNKVTTATKDLTATAQQWALIGSASGFVLKSADGNYLYWNTSNSRFCTTDTKASASTLLLAETGNASASGCWELHVSGNGNYMNQYGGAGTGKELGTWTYGDSNNPFYLISASMAEPTWSVDGTEKYLFVQFCNSGNMLSAQSTSAGQNIVTAKVDPIDQQQWKFVGDKDNFQMVNKSGLYAVMTNGTGAGNARLQTSTSPDGSGFSLVQTSNSTYAPNPEIKWNGNDGSYNHLNQCGGTAVGVPICLWSDGDNNNPVYFVDPDQYEYSEYKISGVSSFTPEHPLTLWYKTSAPATEVGNTWMEYSLPIGNGELGASLFGGAYKDEIQFNEKTLWEGSAQIGSQGYYRNFGSVFAQSLDTDKFSFGSTYPVSNYVRFLDIENGVGGVNFTDANQTTNYQRRYIASAPDQVIAVHYTADGTQKMNMRFTMEPGSSIGASGVSYADGQATFSGAMTTVSYAARLKVVADNDATVTTTEEGITVNNASEITLILKGATNFNGNVADINTYTTGTKADVINSVQTAVEAAATKGWNSLYDDHVADFSSWMNRMTFSLGLTTPAMDTESLVKYYNNNNNGGTSTDNDVLFLEQLYFAYGRYLEIGSNRQPIAAPNNLQGIWNNKAEAPWHSDIHANINVQMNYWPAEATNLSELHLPFLNWTIKNAQGTIWKRAATNYGGTTNGWTFFTENNIYGGMSTWGSNYYVANAWNTSHLWQHYRFTQDNDFLAQAFPVMWSAAQFWMERLIADEGYDSSVSNSSYGGTAYSFEPDGTYVAPNEYSPEQDAHNRENGTAHAQQLIYYLLQNVKDAHNILGPAVTGLSDDDVAKLDDYLEKTDQGLHTEEYTANSTLNGGWTNPRNGVAKGDSILREWKYSPYDVSSDPSHRHLSHLMGLFPLDQIDPESPYFQPAVNSLKLRGDDATGWSLGWKVNLWARALDGDHAHTIIKNALKHSTAYGTNQYAGGIYYNLYDSHAPFQIDGNFGTCSGIAEILLQSEHDYLHILPALPSVWKQGRVTGMKAIGNFTVDEEWKDGKATLVKIVSNAGYPLRVRYDGIQMSCVIVTVNDQPVTPTLEGKIYTIPGVKKGDEVSIYFKSEADLLGDSNNSGEVTVSDIVTDLNYVLEKPYDNFHFVNADVNLSKTVNVADIAGTTKIILDHCSTAEVCQQRLSDDEDDEAAPIRRTVARKAPVTHEASMTLIPSTDDANAVCAELTVDEANFSGLQFDVTLPAGVSIQSIKLPSAMSSFQMQKSTSADGCTTRFVLYSFMGLSIPAGQNTIMLTLSESAESAGLSNGVLSTTRGSDVRLLTNGIGDATALQSVEAPATRGNIYDLVGRKLNTAPRKGVFIQDGKKMLK